MIKNFEDYDPEFDMLIAAIKQKMADDAILEKVKRKRNGNRVLHDIDVKRLNDVYRCTHIIDRCLSEKPETAQIINADGNHRYAEIKVQGNDLTIRDMELFSQLLSTASNVEFYTDKSGMVTMACMFYGIWRD